MTTAALVAGMIPLALGTAARRSLAPHGGHRGHRRQTLCLLTLLVTPVAYSLFDDISQRVPAFSRRFSFPRLVRAARAHLWLMPVLLLVAFASVARGAQQTSNSEKLVAPPRVGVSIGNGNSRSKRPSKRPSRTISILRSSGPTSPTPARRSALPWARSIRTFAGCPLTNRGTHRPPLCCKARTASSRNCSLRRISIFAIALLGRDGAAQCGFREWPQLDQQFVHRPEPVSHIPAVDCLHATLAAQPRSRPGPD